MSPCHMTNRGGVAWAQAHYVKPKVNLDYRTEKNAAKQNLCLETKTINVFVLED